MTVSPERAWPTFLIPAMRYPTSPGPSSLTGRVVGGADPDLLDIVVGARLHEPEAGAVTQDTVDDPHRADDAPVLVVGGVEDQGAQGGVGGAPGGGDAVDHGVEELVHPLAGLGRDAQDLGRRIPRTCSISAA